MIDRLNSGFTRSTAFVAHGRARFTLTALFSLLLLVAMPGGQSALGPGIANAQSSCQIDFGHMQKARVAQIQALNKSAKRGKGKLNPMTACPRLRKLAAIERKMVKYMKDNKAWCGIPDAPIQQLTKTSKQTAATAGRACKAAAMMRRARAQARRQSQGIAAQRPKLPSGPL